jgi:CheY-like chemotaxis protein
MRPVLAANADEAISALDAVDAAGSKFDLVVLDVCMPEVDGFELCHRIRALPGMTNLPIMMLSSIRFAEDIARCRDLGISAYLMKPIGQADLQQTLLSVVCPGGAVPARDSSHVPQPTVPRSALRILVAEDNAVNQRVAKRLLEKQGHSVRIAGDGREALAAFEEEVFDLILMDLQMPEMGGYAATAEIRKREMVSGKRTPVIALTAHAIKGTREECLAAGMDGYVSKPIRPAELWAELGSWQDTAVSVP